MGLGEVGRAAGVLLMGWEGTLAPAGPQGASLPEDVERRLVAMLRDALASVRGAGGGLPVEQLLLPLRQRLLAGEWVSEGGLGGGLGGGGGGGGGVGGGVGWERRGRM